MTYLWAVFLGGKQARSRLGEDHEVVFVVASDEKEAGTKGKAKWSGEIKEGVHIDSVALIDIVDGHTIRLVQGDKGTMLPV